MILYFYLKKYGRNKRRLMTWVASYNGDPVVALRVMKDLAHRNYGFANGSQLDHAVLQMSYDQAKEFDSRFHKMSLWGKLKWLLTRKQ